MSDMPRPVAYNPHSRAALRARAAARLIGKAASQDAVAGSAAALSVLHAMASSPGSAADALALLHELQVHQVEVELQAQELREARVELESALQAQIELYDTQPVACFTVDPESVVLALNRAGAALLGVDRDAAVGLPLSAFFSADAARRFLAAMSDEHMAGAQSPLLLQVRPQRATEQQVLLSIGRQTATNRFVVNMTHAGPARV